MEVEGRELEMEDIVYMELKRRCRYIIGRDIGSPPPRLSFPTKPQFGT
jgi:hypothetical protein